ncbi:MAG: sulfatase-like hydrolase/transferase [Planctomycetota bacterium]
MHRRKMTCGAASALALAAGSACALAQPNIVFIISDDAGWADFGFNDQGNGEIPTPALDSIANDGRWFRAAYTAPVCSPSRARTFLGVHNQRTGYDNNAPDSQDASDSVVQGLRLDDTTMFERMSDRGYHVGYFGKWHLGTERDVVNGNTLITPGNLPPRHGIDYFWGITSGSRSYFIGNASGYTKLLREMSLPNPAQPVIDADIEGNYANGAYMTDITADEVADYVTDRSTQSGPFFAIASFTAPHGPLEAKAADLTRVDNLGLGYTGNRRTYAAMMLSFDDGVQTILDRLDDPNNDGDTSDSIRANTLVCFMNDNGGETANSARNFPLRGKKSDTFDGGIRVMMAMSGPGIPATGASFDFPVDSVDLTPTFLAATGTPIAPDDFTDGVNLLPYLDGTLTGAPRENMFVRGNNPIVAGARDGDFKLTIENIGGPFLYDIVANPGENNVRNADFPEVVESMTDIMNSFEAEYMKPRWGPSDVNSFDGFVYRGGAVGSGAWSGANAWASESGSPATATLFARDGYANLSLRFPAAASGYTATNDLSRPNGLTFIANSIVFDGDYTGVADAGVVVDGAPVMLADSLDGDAPTIEASTTSSGGAYPSELDIEIRLWDDVLLSGTGDQTLVLSGSMIEERDARSATKVSIGELEISGSVDLNGAFMLSDGATSVVGSGTVSAEPFLVADGATLTIGDNADPDVPDYLGNRSAFAAATPTVGGPSVALLFEGAEVVGSIEIDGQPLAQGAYGAATHPDIFSGPGSLIIRGPLDCSGDLDDNGFAEIFDTLLYLRRYDAEDGCGVGAVPLVSGITVNCDANLDAPGDSTWEVTAPGTDLGRAWTFGVASTPVATVSAPVSIPVAYAFPGAAASGPDYEDPSRSPSTIELWINADDFAGDQIIWEAGGGARGGAIWLSGNELRLDVQNGIASPVRASTTLTAGWHQVVAVIDINNAVSRLYVDGALRDTASIGTDRWAGGNPAGLGQVTSSAVGNITPPNFRGQIGIYRAYNSRALNDGEVSDSYQAVITAVEPCSDAADLDGDGVLTAGDIVTHLQQFGGCN